MRRVYLLHRLEAGAKSPGLLPFLCDLDPDVVLLVAQDVYSKCLATLSFSIGTTPPDVKEVQRKGNPPPSQRHVSSYPPPPPPLSEGQSVRLHSLSPFLRDLRSLFLLPPSLFRFCSLSL